MSDTIIKAPLKLIREFEEEAPRYGIDVRGFDYPNGPGEDAAIHCLGPQLNHPKTREALEKRGYKLF